MTDRPLLLKGEMVRAVLREEGPKTQTRRIPTCANTLVDGRGIGKKAWGAYDFDFDKAYVDKGPSPAGNPGPYLQVPSKAYGTTHRLYPRIQPGDRLWVRETFGITSKRNPLIIQDAPMFEYTHYSETEPDCLDGKYDLLYRATQKIDPDFPIRWRPSIFIPRWASRILLEVTDVRVERVQEISEEDAKAEGILKSDGWNGNGMYYAVAFARLWDSINKERGFGWDKNPWVWVLGFKRIEA